jgi:ABC-type polysaccharide/polyol phosphate export permease
VTDVAAPPTRQREDEFAERHVYEPHRVGLPPMGSYLHELWRRRQFALEMSRTTLRAQHFNTVLGLFWLVVNPMMLGFVYFILVSILRDGTRGGSFFAHLIAGLFAFQFLHQGLSQGSKSVVGGGRLILNSAFPRALLPLSAVMTAFMRFLPTLLVYGIVHVVVGLPIGLHLLWAIPILLLLAIFVAGVSMLVAAAQVYFRDIRSFLPYFLRIWLYASPVLYYVDEVPDKFRWVLAINPMTPILGSWSDVLNLGVAPKPGYLLWAAGVAVVAFVIGGLFFISREREFAVRL